MKHTNARLFVQPGVLFLFSYEQPGQNMLFMPLRPSIEEDWSCDADYVHFQ